MKKQQIILVSSGILLLALLFFWGNTIPPQSAVATNNHSDSSSSTTGSTTDQLIAASKKDLPAARLEYLNKLENSVVRGDVKDQQIHAYHQLARFWEDSVHNHLLEAYYRGEAAKLENSEKNLTFAARLMLDQLLTEENPALQNWLGTQAKALFEQSLEINPSNDSAKVGIGACYMFGNISDQPMQGILAVRQVAEKNPDNLYAQMILGMGGMKSGQYDKAIERFKIVVAKEPGNLEAIFRLAECYDRTGDKANAVKWYKDAERKIGEPSIKKEIENRIKALQ